MTELEHYLLDALRRISDRLRDPRGALEDVALIAAEALVEQYRIEEHRKHNEIDNMTHAYDRDLDADLSRRDCLREEAE